jgi:alkylation response protein AidB-like acyl-CoA dehydrogenase
VLRSDQPGVRRSPDLPLIGLRGCDVAAVRLQGALVGPEDRLHADLNAWLPQVRPLFLGAQCGMSIGLARASLFAAQKRVGRREALRMRLAEAGMGLEVDVAELLQGLDDGRFGADPAALFRLRLALALHVQEALALELQAWGGQAYLEGQAPGFARRWREAAFIPIITPSVAQLEMQLLKK